MKILSLAAEHKNLSRVLDFVSEQSNLVWLSNKEHLFAQICAEEIFINICDYAYQNVGYVDVMVDTKNGFSITFRDKGVPYNPLTRKMPNTSMPVQERKIGGLGVFIVKRYMRRVTYRRQNGCNVLTMFL